MAKARRAATARTSTRKGSRRPAAARRTSAKRPARSASRRTSTAAAAATAVRPAAPPPQPVAAPAPARKPTYHEAVALYERGLQALQRRDFAAAASSLRSVIQQYPDERELLERAGLYLKVCERELEPREPAPKNADEWVYAATVALNSGNEPLAEQHLQRALSENPRHDHAHYMMAVASARRADVAAALDHLRQAVTLNPENRNLARQDPDLDSLRDEPAFRGALDAETVGGGRQVAARPRRGRR